MNDLSIIILAAGKGTRMKSNTAKVLHPICGKPMLFHIIQESLKLTNDISVVLAHQAEQIKEKIENKFDNIKIIYQDLEKFPGTGGALKKYDSDNQKILILNGDMPLIQASDMKAFLSLDGDIVMSTITLTDPNGYGRVVIKDSYVQAIVEQKDANEKQLQIKTVNAGVYLISHKVLKEYIPKLDNNNSQKEYYLTDIIQMAKQDNLKITPIDVEEEKFKGVNSKYDLAHAEEIMSDRIKKYWMMQGVTMHLPKTIFIESDVVFESESTIESGVVIKGDTLISNSHIKANSVIENAIIKDSDVGPMARIRPQSYLEKTHIGNFVEVKKSNLTGVKAGHLSYLGDSIIDEGTNIGAGVITCNYDGIKKYQTIIGKNVFVGSDTQLVAPVKIEDDVIVGAGTTVTSKVVKSGVLAISRTPIKIVEGFYYKFFGR